MSAKTPAAAKASRARWLGHLRPADGAHAGDVARGRVGPQERLDLSEEGEGAAADLAKDRLVAAGAQDPDHHVHRVPLFPGQLPERRPHLLPVHVAQLDRLPGGVLGSQRRAHDLDTDEPGSGQEAVDEGVLEGVDGARRGHQATTGTRSR